MSTISQALCKNPYRNNAMCKAMEEIQIMNENAQTKTFHIGDLISIVVGNLVCPLINDRSHPIDGVYEILNWMTGDNLYTHALPRAADECKPVLLAEFPWLVEIKFPDMPESAKATNETANAFILEWLETLYDRHGQWHEVHPLHSEDHETLHPLDEPILKGKKIIGVELSNDSEEPNVYGDIDWKDN